MQKVLKFALEVNILVGFNKFLLKTFATHEKNNTFATCIEKYGLFKLTK
jgi:hypothetical protein